MCGVHGDDRGVLRCRHRAPLQRRQLGEHALHRLDPRVRGWHLRGVHQRLETELHRHQCAPILLGEQLANRNLQRSHALLSGRQLCRVHQLVRADLRRNEHGPSLCRYQLGEDQLHGAQSELLSRSVQAVQRGHAARLPR